MVKLPRVRSFDRERFLAAAAAADEGMDRHCWSDENEDCGQDEIDESILVPFPGAAEVLRKIRGY